jgi:hypothetical protein
MMFLVVFMLVDRVRFFSSGKVGTREMPVVVAGVETDDHQPSFTCIVCHCGGVAMVFIFTVFIQ